MKKSVVTLLIIVFVCYILYNVFKHEHEWIEADCFSPATCLECGETFGDPKGHDWIGATCTDSKYCGVCGKNEGEPLGHSWIDATCDYPKRCSVCGETTGLARNHKWFRESDSSPRICVLCDEMEPMLLPETGEVFIGSELYKGSELKITSSTTDSCYIKLKGTSGNDVFSFFVRAGDTITVPVPRGYYYGMERNIYLDRARDILKMTK